MITFAGGLAGVVVVQTASQAEVSDLLSIQVDATPVDVSALDELLVIR